MPSEENMTTRSAEPTPRSVFRAEADPTVSTSARHARAVNAGTTRRQLGYIEALSLPLLPRMTRGPYAFSDPERESDECQRGKSLETGSQGRTKPMRSYICSSVG